MGNSCTNTFAGFEAFLYIGNSGSADTKIAEVRDIELAIEDELIDVTSHDSAGWRCNLSGLRNWNFTAEALNVTADAGQSIVKNAILNRTELDIELREQDIVGAPTFYGKCLVSTVSKTYPNDDAAAASLEFKGNGPLTEGTVS